MATKISRRSFLRASAVAMLTAALQACAQPTAPPAPTQPAAAPTATPKPAAPAATATPKPVAAPTKFQEAPMLADLVKAGKLPPLDQRLPTEPCVIPPREIGRYGGTWHYTARALATWPGESDALFHGLAMITTALELAADICKSWELSGDYKSITIYLRKGLKWSDGMPLTTEDVRFWWEDIKLNTELTPTLETRFAPGGQPFKLTVADAYTFRFEFTVPYPAILEQLWKWLPAEPKHYLQQYHIKYNDKANELAKSEGYDFWWKCLPAHALFGGQQTDVKRPRMDTWVLESFDAANNQFRVRNPYYWRVDTQGNQLPYIDRFERSKVADHQMQIGYAISGKQDCECAAYPLGQLPLFKDGEQKGGYNTMLYPNTGGSALIFAFNYTHKDPVLRQMFNDIRFRKAASHAINRDEMNEIYWLGRGVPRQFIVDPTASFFEEGIDKLYIEYKPALANQLLDEMGLKWDQNHEYRLRPDGKRISLVVCPETGPPQGSCVVVAGYWKAIGIELIVQEVSLDLENARRLANEIDVGTNWGGGVEEISARQNGPNRWRPGWSSLLSPIAAVEWQKWYQTKGKQGEVPPPEIQRLFTLCDEWMTVPRGSTRYLELGREITRINAENVWVIGTVGLLPELCVVNKNLRNAPKQGEYVSDGATGQWGAYYPDTFFYAS